MRVGGSFIWPPPGLEVNRIKRVMFIAGGVGIKYAHWYDRMPNRFR